ncbi:hypothetical protein [Halorarius litoreus]|uniref:hypothetical protein n=1 Tax=Halorarius litoreus TaxID=2962676 RepID=UPI0020CF4E18|nr:hypothetical protein [Halorarius litoreus]
MADISLTDAQRRRFESIREDLEATFAPRYASVRDEDVVDYLLDTYTPPETTDADAGASAAADTDEASESAASTTPDTESPSESKTTADASETAGATAGEGAARVSSMLQLLDDHADKWSTGAGDAPYEVELPDGSTEPARTKDDVRRILYQNY